MLVLRLLSSAGGEGNVVLGQRPIGILPMLYRLWARVRLREAEDLGLAHPSDYEHGGVRGAAQSRLPSTRPWKVSSKETGLTPRQPAYC